MASSRFPRACIGVGLAMALGAPVAIAAPAAQSPAAQPKEECFASSDWDGWKATPDSRTVYIRVGINKIFRIDLASECPELQDPVAHLVTTLRGSAWICRAIDLDLKVSDGHGFVSPCFVSKLTRLTPEEAAALPKKLRP